MAALFWGGWIFIRLVWLCWPQRQGEEEMGYIVPGSGWLARSWAVVGRQIYRLRRAFSLSFAFVRDLNIEKLYLPLAVLAFSILGAVSTSFALENMLFELHVALPGIFSATGWMRPVSLALGFLCALMVGLPMLAESFRQTHSRALKRRQAGQRLVFRLLAGLGGTVTILAPAAWMLLGLLAGDLRP